MVPVLLALLPLAAACRYTVRDIGFVDLRGPVYALDRVEPGGAGAAGWSAAERAAVAAARAETNLVVTRVDPRAEPDHPAVLALRAAGGAGEPPAGWVLRRSGGPPLEPLVLARGAPPASLDQALALALDSPLQRRLAAGALTSFAAVLQFEGADGVASATARAAVERARAALAEIETQLPRPIEVPLRAHVVPAPRAGAADPERVLRWSLGIPEASRGPAVAVLYGRGVRAGAPVAGAELEGTELVAQLALVGESCECDTDRDWVREPAVPLRWSDGARAAAPAALGFDPESPAVQAEVARILGHRVGGGGGSARPGGEEELAELVFGYRESGLSPGTGAAAAPGSAGAPAAGAGPVRVYREGAGDWDFEEPEPEPATGVGRDSPSGPEPGPGLGPLWIALALFAAASLAGAAVLLARGRAA